MFLWIFFFILVLTVTAFYLPPESGERITLVITNLLAMTVFMLLVADIMPSTSEVIPVISIYFSSTLFEVCQWSSWGRVVQHFRRRFGRSSLTFYKLPNYIIQLPYRNPCLLNLLFYFVFVLDLYLIFSCSGGQFGYLSLSLNCSHVKNS